MPFNPIRHKVLPTNIKVKVITFDAMFAKQGVVANELTGLFVLCIIIV